MSVLRGSVDERGRATSDGAQSTRANPSEQADGASSPAGDVHANALEAKCMQPRGDRENLHAPIGGHEPESIASHANNARQLVSIARARLGATHQRAPWTPIGWASANHIDEYLNAIDRRLLAIVERERTVHADPAAEGIACTSTDPDQVELSISSPRFAFPEFYTRSER